MESQIEAIPDTGDIDCDYTQMTQYEDKQIHSSCMIGVQLDSNKACSACKTVQIEPTSPTLGLCIKCSILQKLEKCCTQMSAKLIFEIPTMGTGSASSGTVTLSVFGDILKVLANVDSIEDVTEESLLTARPLIAYNSNNVITSFIADES